MTLTSLITKALPFLLLYTTFFSCRDGGRIESILRTTDSLMEEHPDSALSILRRDSLEICRSGKDYRLWYALSRTEADDKCYILHVSDSTMRAAANYYNSHGSDFQRVRANYLLGRVYCDMHLYGHALTSFNKAITVESENDSTINRYKARSATWAGYVYEVKGLHKDALRYNKLAYGYAKQAGAQVTEVYSLRDIGRSYRNLNRNDIAIPYYQQAAKKAKAINDSYLYNMVRGELAAIYMKEGLLDKAKYIFNIPLNGYTENNKSANYYIRAVYYENTEHLDSAIYYNKKGMQYGSLKQNLQASLDLANLYIKTGDQADAISYYSLYSNYVDSLMKNQIVEYGDLMSGMERILDVERRNADLTSSRLHLVISLFVLILCIIIFCLALAKIYQKRKKKYLEQQERVRRYRRERSLKEQQRSQQNKERIALLENELSDSNKMLSELHEKLIRNETEMLKYKETLYAFEQKHQELLVADLADTDVYKLYHTPNVVPSSADYHRLVEALNKAYNNFTKRLKEFYPDINDNEVWICCMVKAGLSSKEICNISPYSYSSLGMAKSRLYFKMFQKKGGAKDLDHFIKEL